MVKMVGPVRFEIRRELYKSLRPIYKKGSRQKTWRKLCTRPAGMGTYAPTALGSDRGTQLMRRGRGPAQSAEGCPPIADQPPSKELWQAGGARSAPRPALALYNERTKVRHPFTACSDRAISNVIYVAPCRALTRWADMPQSIGQPPTNDKGVTAIGSVRLRWRGTPTRKLPGHGGNWLASLGGTRVPACLHAAIQNDTAMSSHQPAEVYHLLTLPEAASRLTQSRRTLERMIADGRFPPPIKINTASRVLLSDVERYLAKRIEERRVRP